MNAATEMLTRADPGAVAPAMAKRADMSWTDHLVMLLHVGAEIEHALMVQYLYAAYSLGGDQVPPEHRAMVARWRHSILAVAKEEMGHLLTVQNVLTALGAPINLARSDFPWDAPYYPFAFRFEPLSLESLSCYVFAEMPPLEDFARTPGRRQPARYREFTAEDRDRIAAAAHHHATGGTPHPVGIVYEAIIELIADPSRIPDSAFADHGYAMQQSFDDWGRNYRPDPYLLDASGNRMPPDAAPPNAELAPPSGREAVVLIDRVATRTQAVAALRRLSAQGEALHMIADDSGEPSHFERFLEIYQEFERHVDGSWSPTHPIASNPSCFAGANDGEARTLIADPGSRRWADLFNLRYRMLLSWLAHSFRLARAERRGAPSLRAMAMHKVFGEMYNLKTLSGLLVTMPIGPDHPGLNAGPPFDMPYALDLPPAEPDAWRLHRMLLETAQAQCAELIEQVPAQSGYLGALMDIDRQSLAWVNSILDGNRGEVRP